MLSAGLVNFIYLEVIPLALENAGHSEQQLFAQLAQYDFSPAIVDGEDIVKCPLEEASRAALLTRNFLFVHTNTRDTRSIGIVEQDLPFAGASSSSARREASYSNEIPRSSSI